MAYKFQPFGDFNEVVEDSHRMMQALAAQCAKHGLSDRVYSALVVAGVRELTRARNELGRPLTRPDAEDAFRSLLDYYGLSKSAADEFTREMGAALSTEIGETQLTQNEELAFIREMQEHFLVLDNIIDEHLEKYDREPEGLSRAYLDGLENLFKSGQEGRQKVVDVMRWWRSNVEILHPEMPEGFWETVKATPDPAPVIEQQPTEDEEMPTNQHGRPGMDLDTIKRRTALSDRNAELGKMLPGPARDAAQVELDRDYDAEYGDHPAGRSVIVGHPQDDAEAEEQ